MVSIHSLSLAPKSAVRRTQTDLSHSPTNLLHLQSTGLMQRSSSDENAAVNVNMSGKPKPLQASTNIIHAKTPRRIDNLIHDKSRQLTGHKLNDPLRKKHETTLSNKKQTDLKASQPSKKSENDLKHGQKSISKNTTTTPVKKVDENDVGAMVENAYNPLNDVYPFDEKLFQKVMELECADDGIPKFEDYGEPFDF